jgi:hypothetical protein
MSATANFAATARSAPALVSTANTARDGTGTIADVLVAGASGSRIDSVRIKAIQTTTAGMIRLFLNNGVSAFLIKEIPVDAIVVGANTAGFDSLVALNVSIPNGSKLGASTHNAESFHVTAFGGDF